MQKQSVRVVIASEYPQMRHFLGRVIEQEGGVDIVGLAPDARGAFTLVKNLIPDVAVIDSYLPYDANLDTILMSRINGLDTAQAILTERPSIRVILLSNLDTAILSDRDLGSGAATTFSIRSREVNIALAPQDLDGEVLPPNDIVFASVETKQPAALQQQVTSITDKAIFFGSLGLASGWLITLTVFLAPIGIPIAVVGAATMFLGLLGKWTASLCRKIKGGTKGRLVTKQDSFSALTLEVKE